MSLINNIISKINGFWLGEERTKKNSVFSVSNIKIGVLIKIVKN